MSKEILEESRIPYTYNLIDFSRASIEGSGDEIHALLKEWPRVIDEPMLLMKYFLTYLWL